MSARRPIARVPGVAEFDNAIQDYLERMAALRYADMTTCLVISSDSWPPSAETTLADGPAYSYSLRLSAFPDGHLAVTLCRDDETTPLIAAFQRLALSDDSSFLTYRTVRDERVTLKVLGSELGPYCPEQAPPEFLGSPKTAEAGSE
jgi:hypothetical protein